MPKRKTYAELLAERDKLNDEVYRLGKIISRINGEFDLYYDGDESGIFQAIGKLRGELRILKEREKEREGSINRSVELTNEENLKLWYLLRVALKDETVKDVMVKPGEEYRPERGGIYKAFNI